MPPFDTTPVHFAGGGRVISTHPHKAGDEGIVLFGARNIDAWHQQGGSPPPVDSRVHNLSDGFLLACVRSDPRKVANVAPESIQHRGLDGKVTHDVHPTDGTTTKVVDPSDGAANPFVDATKYHQTIHNATTGIVKTATDAIKTHTETLLAAIGYALSVTKPSHIHTIDVHPDNGVSIASTIRVALSAPPGQLALPAGGVQAAALDAGAAAANVGALGGDLSGTLPNPNVVGITNVANATALPIYANNAAALTGGLVAGQLYRNNVIFGSEHVICAVH